MAISLVQTIGGTSTFASTTLTWGSNTTTGNLIIVGVQTTGSASSVSSITDSQSNTYTQIFANSAHGDMELWYAKNITGGTTPTITVAYGGNYLDSAIAREYSGIATTAPLDVSNGTATGVFTSPENSNSVTTTQASELLIGILGYDSNPTIAAGTGWSNVTQQYNTDGVGLIDQIVSSTGSYSAQFTGASGSNWSCGIATFKAATATGATAHNLIMLGVGK